ncbi:MAG TPA: hypothetical protein VK717_09575 [Opitutaceae bacterium]|nr:hypothetical protein [Opitutaceae bacterium]
MQDDSVFADFDIDDGGHVALRRISFDGFGCYGAPENLRRISLDHSRILIDSVALAEFGDPQVEQVLRRYFRDIANTIEAREALATHELL